MQSHLHLQQYYPTLAAQAPLGPAVQNAVISAPMTGQLPPATGPVPNVQTGTASHMSLGQVPDQYHSPDKVTAQLLEAAAARLQVITMLTHNNFLLVPPHT